MGSDEKDLSYEAWASYLKAEKAGKVSSRESHGKSGGSDNVEGGGRVLNGFNRRTGVRNRCFHLRLRVPLGSRVSSTTPVDAGQRAQSTSRK